MIDIVKMKFGSVLYGTNSEKSDTDYKGIFLPSLEMCLLNRIPKCFQESTSAPHHKNTSSDIDNTMYSLQYYMQLLREGQVCALDMLFCPKDMLISSSGIWDDIIVPLKDRLIGKNLKAFMGYCRTQTHKYGVKGSRMSAVQNMLELLSAKSGNKLIDVYAEIPESEHVSKYTCTVAQQETLEVCGRKFQGCTPLAEVIGALKKIYTNYGHRSIQAQQNDNIDWKAVSHAFRVCYEVYELITEHKITFPLKEAEFIKDVKYGKLHFINDNIPEKLDELMSRVHTAAKESTLPDTPDIAIFDEIVKSAYESRVLEKLRNKRSEPNGH